MNNVHASGAASGTCSPAKRRLLLLFLVSSLLCFTAGELFLPHSAAAANAKASATSVSGPAAKKSVAQKSVKKSTPSAQKPRQKTAAKKSTRSVQVRSLASDAERASLRERGISSGFGERAISRKRTRMHKGIDIPAPKGCKIMAYNDGEVIFAGVKNGYGKTVIIRQIDGREALYAHMSRYVVSIGDQLKRGGHVGHVGRTGRATGCHLHFELVDDGENLDPSMHVWHGSELVLGPGDLDPDAVDKTQVASPTPRRSMPVH